MIVNLHFTAVHLKVNIPEIGDLIKKNSIKVLALSVVKKATAMARMRVMVIFL